MSYHGLDRQLRSSAAGHDNCHTGTDEHLPGSSSAGYRAAVARRWRLLPQDPEIGWVPYVWLLYIGFVFLTPVFGELDEPVMWLGSSIATAVFVPLYFAGYWVEGGRRLAIAVAIAAIGAALAPLNPGASTFFIYAAYFAGLSDQRPLRSLSAVGLILLLTLLTAWQLAPNIYFTAPAALGVVVIGLLGLHFIGRHVQVAELRMARAEVETLARIAERDRIARDLHDLLGHTLSVIALKAELSQALVSRDPKRAAAEAGEIQLVARKALSEVRTAVTGYRVGSGAGLRQELEGVERALDAAGVTLHVDEGPERVAGRADAAHEVVLALALREASTNIMRHANATLCRVSFFTEGRCFGVEIQDDGRGLSGRRGHGLLGMEQRVEALGGQMRLTGDRQGTRLRLEFTNRDEVPSRTRAGEVR